MLSRIGSKGSLDEDEFPSFMCASQILVGKVEVVIFSDITTFELISTSAGAYTRACLVNNSKETLLSHALRQKIDVICAPQSGLRAWVRPRFCSFPSTTYTTTARDFATQTIVKCEGERPRFSKYW